MGTSTELTAGMSWDLDDCWLSQHHNGWEDDFSFHSNPSSYIAYIQAGHNSDFAFQKTVSGMPMPKKEEILLQKSVDTKVGKVAKTKL
jgi:hypothetical protein